MSSMKYCSVIIIGAGVAGLSAAIYIARAELKPLVFAGQAATKGGMLTKTSIVENYPGFQDGIDGFQLINNMEIQAVKYGSQIIDRDVVSVEVQDGGNHNFFKLVDDSNDIYITKTIIIATGSTPNKLGLPNEQKLWGYGISSCAVCDGALYKNKKIIVVGGGDSAMENALFLTKFSNVTLIHRRDTFRADYTMQRRVLLNPKINIIYNTQVTKLIGDTYLEAIEITSNDGEIQIMPVDGLFYGLGLTPNTKLFENILEMDDIIHKYEGNMTSVNGIFVAGDVSDNVYRQAVVAAGDGCKAALDVINYLDST